jgi:hypothetical protein
MLVEVMGLLESLLMLMPLDYLNLELQVGGLDKCY